jgi:hypothetical protein
VSFKKKEPKADVEAAFLSANGFGDFDYAFVVAWPTNADAAAQCESILLRLLQGGLEYFAFRSASHGDASQRDAKLVVKVRLRSEKGRSPPTTTTTAAL